MKYTREDAQNALNDLSDPELKPFDYEFARCVVLTATVADVTIATAESVTGGLVSQLLTRVAGSSTVFRGGVVAYSTDLKHQLLGVDEQLLQRGGPVQSDVAIAMAQGAATRLNARFGIATTGVAGPEASGDRPVGEVHIALFDAQTSSSRVHSLKFSGTRDEIREQTAIALFGLALDVLIPLAGLVRPAADTPEA
jgi:nicotinamide-nucleotide amidase